MKTKIILIVVFGAFLLFPNLSYAGLVPCGGEGQNACTFCDFFVLIDNVIKFFLVPDQNINNNVPLVPVIAVLMIAIGGFMLILAHAGVVGESDMLSRAKSLFKAVVIGLLVAYGAWIIIHTFFKAIGTNPDFNLEEGWYNIQCESSGGPQGRIPSDGGDERIPPADGDGTSIDRVAGTLTHEEAAELLNQSDIGISSSRSCSYQNDPDCTSLNGIPASTINSLTAIKRDCPQCSITVTGGTETGHSSHGFGKPAVDLRNDENTANFLRERGSEYGVKSVLEESNPNHLHVQFQ